MIRLLSSLTLIIICTLLEETSSDCIYQSSSISFCSDVVNYPVYINPPQTEAFLDVLFAIKYYNNILFLSSIILFS